MKKNIKIEFNRIINYIKFLIPDLRNIIKITKFKFRYELRFFIKDLSSRILLSFNKQIQVLENFLKIDLKN